MGFVNRTNGSLTTLASLRRYVKISRYSVSALQSNAYAEMLGKGSTLLWGLGREAAKHIVRLGATRFIITARDTTNGEAAKQYIKKQTGRKDVIEVWELDLSDFDSVRSFAMRVNANPKSLGAVTESAELWPQAHAV